MSHYQAPEEKSFLTGVVCPYCAAGADERCTTTGGRPYGELCHKKRKDAAREQTITLTVTELVVNTDPSVAGKVQALKIAFWYIDKMGGVERARAYFEAACATVENLGGLPEGIKA